MNVENQNFAAELAARSVGCRLSFRWVGNSKAVDSADNSAAAALFQANPRAVKLSKKLFDDSRAEWKTVQAIKGKIRRFWVENTLPYTDRGVRLLRRDEAEQFARAVDDMAAELAAAVAELENVFQELLAENRERLGSLFNRSDYPATLIGEFSAAVEFPELNPPNYLATLSPELYQRESQRVSARFDQALELAETAFADELSALVSRLVDRLQPDENGQPKVFRDSTIENFREFIARFRRLSIGSSAELDRLVEQAGALVGGVRAADVRQPGETRERLAAGMNAIASELAAGVVNRPTRVIRFNQAAADVQPFAELSAGGEQPPAADVQPEPAASQAIAVEPQPAAELSADEPAAELETESEQAITADASTDEPERIDFVLNYGGGKIRRLSVPMNPAALAAAAG